MNDSVIINTISKIHFILVSIFSFIFVILLSLFILLQNGIYIDNISLQNIKIKQLYIKWDEKISVVVKELDIKKSDSKLDYKKTLKILKDNLTFTEWFKEVIVEKISFNDMQGSINYSDTKDGFLNISSPYFTLKSSFFSEKNLLNMQIDEFRSTTKNIAVGGNLILNTKNTPELLASLKISINSDVEFNLYAFSNMEKLSYKIKSDKHIQNTKQIVDLFDMDTGVKYWVHDAIEMSSLSLEALYGWIDYKNIDNAYLNLYAKAVANDLTYTYDKKLQSVSTSSTDLEFKDGVLYIRPQNAYSYGFFLDKSWLKIDFSKREELLTLYLLFQGQANKDLLTLLERYEIKLPFVQTKGIIDTNLKLEINLISTDVEAVGDLYAKEAQINYLDLDIDIYDAHIFIKNSDVKVANMVAKYKDIASSMVDLNFNGKSSSGTLAFRFDKIESSENNFMLDGSKKPLAATYIISPTQDYLSVEKSSWKYKKQALNINALLIPFDIKNLKIKIPTTAIEAPNFASALLSGDFFLKSKKANLNIDLLKLNYSNIKLDKIARGLNLAYDENGVAVSSKNPIKLDFENKKITLDNFAANITPASIKVDNLLFDFEDVLKSTVNYEYDLENSIGVINLNNIEFANSSFGEIFENNENIELLLQNKNNKTSISSKEYDFEYQLDDYGWMAKINSIEKMAKHSKLLQDYNLTNGNLTVEKKESEKNIKFSLQTNYGYKFLVTKNKPVDNYTVAGEYDGNTKETSLKINDLVSVNISDDIKIKAHDTGINIYEILNFFDDKNSTKEAKKAKEAKKIEEADTKKPKIYFDATNCYIYLNENRHIISDTINLHYINKILSAELKHKKGSAEFKLSNDKMYLYGENFNDEFMEKLFSLSKFKGGSLEFFVNGSLDEYDGTISVKDTTILDYKILNNILAFVNTVPSLVTFSLPGYNKSGVAAKNAYINFKFKDDTYKMSDIYLKSKEIEIVGLGEASIVKNTINLDLNLITSLGSSFSKIPLLGQILMGKENISTTLTVTGALDNPDVNTQVAKDIAVAPFNIIKRAFMYPFELFKSDDK